MPQPLRAPKPTEMATAPIIPPMSAWEELDGMPTYQVRRFQMMAPVRPATMISSLIILAEMTISPPIVLATPVEIMAPIKFRMAVPMIARPGRIARVDTQVAMALAVSWNPLIKSKIRARTTTRIIMYVSSILHNHSFDQVAQCFHFIGRFFDGCHRIFPADDVEERHFSAENTGHF